MAAHTDAQKDWQRVKQLLADVLDQPSPAREAMAARLSDGDTVLHKELLSLLAAQADESKLDAMPPELAMEALQARFEEQVWRGRRVGPWRIVDLIARGGMGEVYRAERADGQFEQRVAIKLLRSGFDREWLVSRFAVERQIVASLDHPNLARVLDGGTTDDGMPYFVMELVEGEPIDRYCQRLSLPVAARLALFRTVCQVVGYAHSKGVVHRDLKSDNILVTAQGMVKLVDFGIAKQLDTGADQTATGQRVMTLAFSSPEQVRGQEITPASDVYSLGVALYRLLTQASPYGSVTADSSYELTRAICDTEPQPPSRAEATQPATLTRSQRRRLRGDLDAVVMMALRKDPQRRYANAAEMGDDIFRHMENLPVRARRGAWSYRANRFVLRHRIVFGAAMLANLALIVGLGLAVYESVEATRQRERAERHLAAVRKMADVLIVDVNNAITDLPGSSAAHQIVVSNALKYLEGLANDPSADPALQLQTARGYLTLADATIRLEKYESALMMLERARRILSSIPTDASAARRFFDNVQFEIAYSILRRGQVLTKLKRVDEAKAAFRSGIELEAALSRNQDYKKGARDLIAGMYFLLLDLRLQTNDFNGLLELSDQLTSGLDAALASTPADAALRANVVSAHGIRADYFFKTKRDSAGLAEAIAADRETLQIAAGSPVEPHSTALLRNTALAETNLGHRLVLAHRYDEAIRPLTSALGHWRELTQAEPASTGYVLDTAGTYSVYCAAQVAGGHVDEGRASCREALDRYAKVPAPAEPTYELRETPAVANYWFARSLQMSPKRSKAVAAGEICSRLRDSLSTLTKTEARFGQSPWFTSREVQDAMGGC